MKVPANARGLHAGAVLTVMSKVVSHFRAGTACLAALGSSLLAPGAHPAHAQTIENVASASWDDDGVARSVSSNKVAFELETTPARIATLTPRPGGSDLINLRASYCRHASSTGPAQVTEVSSTQATPLSQTDVLRVGQTLVIRIEAPQANHDATAVEEIVLRLTTPGGDGESLIAVETAPDSGVFFAAIQTGVDAPAPLADNCLLGVADGESVAIAAYADGQSSPFLLDNIGVLADPFGTVFDSLDGTPIDGAVVTLVDAATGQPANVYAFDGVTPYPATIISGTGASDSSGRSYSFQPGEYRFPLVAFGEYRLVVQPPAPYTAPSRASPAALAALRHPSGQPYAISDASFGGDLTVDSVHPVQVDIPLDSAGASVTIDKRASRDIVQAGDAIFYTLTLRNSDRSLPTRALTIVDSAAAGLRLRPGSLRLDGQIPADGLVPAPDGGGFSLQLDALAAGATATVTYAMTVREDAPVGDAPNNAVVTSPAGNARAVANVRIERDGLTGRMTIIGRVVDGACGRPEDSRGIPGVRVMMEDGSFAITDADGRYHFEGVVPGNHVVQAVRATLPEGGEFLDCVDSTRSAESAISRFVGGRGGSLARADFHARLPEGYDPGARLAPDRPVLDDVAASGAEIDFVALGDGPDGFLFPVENHNPRSPSVRVAIRHRANENVVLKAGGKPVDDLAFDGTKPGPKNSYAVSIWRAIPLEGPRTRLVAEIRNSADETVQTLERVVNYATTPLRAEVVAEQSHLMADGATPPVLAVRMLDRLGRPVHAGISGSLSLESPYQAISGYEARQSAELSGFGNVAASWTVEGDDGIAYIRLAPTMVSGALRATFSFTDGETSRQQEIEAWMVPGDQLWTLIGLAEGSIGARTVAENMERAGDGFESDLGDKARVAFYAKGRVLGKYLLTIAYDSAKQEADQRLLGTIDPAAYYTIFADRSQRLFDAASRDKLYVRIEGRTFYALYGDLETGFDQTQLARYQRVVTGVRGEARIGQVGIEGFVAEVGSRHRREEIQGDGTSGPYHLGSRRIVPNSAVVAIEVRDRLRSEIIVSRRELVRFVDYDIDLLSGTISFAEPVLSRDIALNPQFIVIDYDVDALGQEEVNAGVRAHWTSADGQVRVGATALSDKGEEARTNLGAADLRVRIGTDTEVRAEVAVSEQDGERASAYLAEIEHHSGRFDIVAYTRQVDQDFGVGQQNLAERGRRKYGVDGRMRVTETLSLAAGAWHDESLTDAAARDALELRAAWRTATTDAFLGLAHLSDTLANGREGKSTVLQAGATQRLLDNRLELTGTTSLPLGDSDSVDLPARHTLGARYSVARNLRLIGSYEIARGDAVNANTLKFGAEVTPWEGGKLLGTVGNERLGTGPLDSDAVRQFAAVTLGHSFRLGENLLIDATVDTNKTLGGGISPGDVVNPAHPISSGGQFGSGGSLGEDFTAVTLGAAWSRGSWSARARGEWRDGEFADRKGIDLAAIRQLGEGSAVGSSLIWTRSENELGGTTEIVDAAISAAHRPARSDFSFVGKLEYRSDAVTGAAGGDVGAAGRTVLLVDGDARARRLLAGVSANWTPVDDEDSASRTEVGVFAGVRHNFDRLEDFDLAGTTVLGGLDLRIGVGDRVELGGRASVRHNLEDGTMAFAVGPEVGLVPADNVLVSVGYNVVGFRDPDYSQARATDKGLFATLKVKFDDFSLGALGLGR